MKKLKQLKDKFVPFRGDIEAYCVGPDGKEKWRKLKKNVVAYVGLQAIWQRMANEYADPLLLSHAALGTGTSTPNPSNTQLQTEVFRNTSPITTGVSNVLYADAVFGQSEVAGNFREFGFFIDGDVGANSGILWNRVSVNWDKELNDTLFVRARFTAVNATP